jgi:8-oxo-dGTP pyrophosphatase MutT (NUDIX family)
MPRVVSCVLMDEEGKILILKRSDKVRTYKGCWSGVAGYIEEGEQPLDTAYKELFEEVKIERDDVELVIQGYSIEFTDIYEKERYNWKIYPFLFKTRKKSKIQIDWEHIEYRWIVPSEIVKYETAPRFKEVVLNLLK